jgi:solute:Na+ symporter, SSS family
VTLAWDSAPLKAMMHLPPVLAQRDAIFPALFAAVTAMFLVSALTPKPAAEQLAQFAD